MTAHHTWAGFGFRHYRSFGTEAFLFPVIRKFNIILGQNNSGKSNILRFLRVLHERYRLGKYEFHPKRDRHTGTEEDASLLLRWDISSFQLFDERAQDAFEKAGIEHLTVGKSLVGVGTGTLEEDLNGVASQWLLHLLSDIQPKYVPTKRDCASLSEDIARFLIGRGDDEMRQFVQAMIFLPDIRFMRQGDSNHESGIVIDGTNVIYQLHEMQNPQVGEEAKQEKFAVIQSFVRDLLDEPDLKMEVTHDRKELVLRLHGNRLPLQSFGTGVHQLIISCCALSLYENHVVCIEEPESHLHPRLQRRFMQFLRERTNNTYFITTHSNIWLELADDVTICHILHDGTKSRCECVVGSTHVREVLDDLGYRASEILQANGILWVEGPSDRIYLLRWIEIERPDLKEGIHFSIMFYGGSNLAHLAGDDGADEFINILKINRNCIVVMDSDSAADGKPLAPRKKHIIAELGAGAIWITKGREIENYISSGVWSRFLASCSHSLVTFSVSRTTNVGKTIAKVTAGTSKVDYASHKAAYSRDIAKLIKKGDMDVMDLTSAIAKTCAEIDTWNG